MTEPIRGPTIDFWQQHFESGRTPWDRRGPGPQLVAWLGREVMRGQQVVVPGCGSGWDVAALAAFGATVTGLDYAPIAVERARALIAERSLAATIVAADVLTWMPAMPVDVVYEQTCLCALYPDLWPIYAAQLHRWIAPHGKLLAMFMQAPRPRAAQGVVEGPPYHCDINAMHALFPADRWVWPKAPYDVTPHPADVAELGVVLLRRP